MPSNRKVLLLAISLAAIVQANTLNEASLLNQKVSIEQYTGDLDKSASSYSYRNDGPVQSYVQVRQHSAPFLERMIYSNENGHGAPLQTIPLTMPEYVLQPTANVLNHQIPPKPIYQVHEYENGGGEQYNAQDNQAHGEKEQKGYKTNEDFEKNEHGSHGREHNQKHHKEKAGERSGHKVAAEHHGNHQQGHNGKKGESFHQSAGHTKGSKTTGFHKVYHKDEYKKDKEFYDEKHDHGHHTKYGDEHAHHNAEEGGHHDASKFDAGFRDAERGSSGFVDEGKFFDEHAGFDGRSGFDEKFKNGEAFAKKAHKSDGSEYGFKRNH